MSKHYCPSLAMCLKHPKWSVKKYSPMSRLWFAVAPGGSLFFAPVFYSHAPAVAYATSRARAEALAAVQSAEGVTAR